MKKIFCGVLLLIFLIGFSSAITYKRSAEISLKIPTNETSCTVTISYPNSTAFVSEGVMTTNTGYANYTIGAEYTEDLGNYEYFSDCGFGSFQITPSGKAFTEGEAVTGLGIIIVALVIAFFFMFFGFKLSENENFFPLTLFFILISFAFVVYSLHLSYAYTIDIMQYESLGNVTSIIYTTVLWLLVSVGILSVILILISSIKAMGEAAKKKEYGEDFNPVTNSYDL